MTTLLLKYIISKCYLKPPWEACNIKTNMELFDVLCGVPLLLVVQLQ